MKRLLVLLLLLGLSACATTDYASLESRVIALEKRKAPSARDTMLLAEQAGARKFWWRNGLSGGGDSLDGVSYAILTDGDAAFVMTKDGTTMTGYLYVYNSTDTAAEDLPLIVAPNDGGGRWYLVNFNVAVLTSNAASGYHYIIVSNPTTYAGTASEGMCYFKVDTNQWCCYNGGWKCETLD